MTVSEKVRNGRSVSMVRGREGLSRSEMTTTPTATTTTTIAGVRDIDDDDR